MKAANRYHQALDPLQENCPVRAALDVIRGRWKPSILYELREGAKRYSELQAALPMVSPQMLASQLRELEGDEVISRTVYPEVPTRVEYRLSEFGLTLSDILDRLESWGETYLSRRRAAK